MRQTDLQLLKMSDSVIRGQNKQQIHLLTNSK